MEQTANAFNLIYSALNAANAKGVFTLNDAEQIIAAIKHLGSELKLEKQVSEAEAPQTEE